MKHFFVIGLPRTRSAWLANFLSTSPGDSKSFCHHEAMRTVSNLEELKAKLDASDAEIVGDADPTLCPILPKVIEAFPDAKFVFIERPVKEVMESHHAAFPKLELSEERMFHWSEMIDEAILYLREDKFFVVRYHELDNPATCNRIHEFCLGREMDAARYEMLAALRVTTIAEKAAPTLAPWARVQLSTMSNPMPASCKLWYALITELCGTNEPAREWLSQLWALGLLWDHLTDGDEVNLAQAELVFEAVLLKWPANVFWMKNAGFLTPVLSNALSAWRHGGREREYDVYTETALAVAYLIGGAEWAKQFSSRIRKAAAEMLADDNRLDGQALHPLAGHNPPHKEAA